MNKSIIDKSNSIISSIDFSCNKQAEVNDDWLSEYAPITMFSINGPLIWADYSTIGAFLIKRNPIVFQGVNLFTDYEENGVYFLKEILHLDDIKYRYKFWVWPIIGANVPLNNLSAYESGWGLKYLSYFDNKYTKFYTNAFYKWLNGKPDITLANHSRIIDYNFAFTPGYIWFNYGQGNVDVSEKWMEPAMYASEAIKLLHGALKVVEVYKKISSVLPVNQFNIAREIEPIINLSKILPAMNSIDDVKTVINLSKYEDVQEFVLNEVKEVTGKNLFTEQIFSSAFQLALDYILGSFTAEYAFPAWVVMDNVKLQDKNHYNAQVVGLHEDIYSKINLPSSSEIGKTSEWDALNAYGGMKDALISVVNHGKTYDASDFMTNATLNGNKINIKCDMSSLLTGGVNNANQVIEPFNMYINVNGSYGNLVLVGVEAYG